ncbi:cytochrome c [Rhizobium sp. SG_E_25_P2]|jgi:cytochrome c|uniref:c-type cytochrome n=1 Tax=Rhizobium sp. SG_E_25_P2 TaxID=2879942 RepID=UPI002473E7C4|nr:cytochrome c family protein [Rhizobium sp. SG_E_25_P2]MDH6264799.1 cytochrome c [Rhizobium sp. SG_E_25_P2]
MNSYVNMGIGALLGTVFVLMSVSIASEGLFHAENPEKPGFEIAAAEPTEGGAPAADAAPAMVPIADLMASADPARGETLFKKCASCHSAEKGGGNKVGPNLYGVVGRPIAHLADFSYSGPMKEFAQGGKEVWGFDHLNHFLLAPKKYIKGTAMGFAGDKKDQERADIIAFLNSKSDAPLPPPAK